MFPSIRICVYACTTIRWATCSWRCSHEIVTGSRKKIIHYTSLQCWENYQHSCSRCKGTSMDRFMCLHLIVSAYDSLSACDYIWMWLCIHVNALWYYSNRNYLRNGYNVQDEEYDLKRLMIPNFMFITFSFVLSQGHLKLKVVEYFLGAGGKAHASKQNQPLMNPIVISLWALIYLMYIFNTNHILK